MNAIIEREDIRVIITALGVYLNESIGESAEEEDRAAELVKALQKLLDEDTSDNYFQLI